MIGLFNDLHNGRSKSDASGQAVTSSSWRQEGDLYNSGRGFNIHMRQGRKCQQDDTHTRVRVVAWAWWMIRVSKLPPSKGNCQSQRCYEMIGRDSLCATPQFSPRAPQYRRSVRTLIKDLMLRSWQTDSLCSELKVCVFRAKDLVANTFLRRASHIK